MNRIIALAQIIFLSGLRKNTVWGLCLFAILLEVAGIMFMDFFGRDLGRVIVDFQFSIMWAAGVLFLLFYAIHIIAWDDEHRTIDGILARPISRVEYVLGMLLGIFALFICFEGILGFAGYLQILWIRPLFDDSYFPVFSTVNYWLTWIGLQFILLALLSIAMLISSLLRGAFPVMLMTLAYSLICSGLPVVRESLRQSVGGSIDNFELIFQGMTLFFPDYSRLDFKDSVVSEESIEVLLGAPVLPALVMIGLYIGLITFLTCFIYKRKDIL